MNLPELPLLPCPFCGGQARNVSAGVAGPSNRWHAGDSIFAVNCSKCGGSVPNRYRNDLVVEAWNTRAEAQIIAAFLERTGQYVTNDASREAAIEEAVKQEREQCAKLCEGLDRWLGEDVATAIRARTAVPEGDCGNAECGWRGPLSKCSYLGSVGPCCPKCREIIEPDAAPEAERPNDAQINAAAKVLAECMDYPWAQMPEQGRANMREHAWKIIQAAYLLRSD